MASINFDFFLYYWWTHSYEGKIKRRWRACEGDNLFTLFTLMNFALSTNFNYILWNLGFAWKFNQMPRWKQNCFAPPSTWRNPTFKYKKIAWLSNKDLIWLYWDEQ